MQQIESLSKAIQFAEKLIVDYCKEKQVHTEETVILSLFRKIVELSDGVFVNADHELEGPATLCFRGVIEAYLSFEYILLEPESIKQRALAYYVSYQYQHLDIGKQIIRGKEKRQNPDGKDKEYYYKVITEYEKILQNDELRETVNEWKRVKKVINQKRRGRPINPKWHSLYNGPKTINRLAIIVQEQKYKDNDRDLVADLYSMISASAHNYLALNAFYTKDGEKILQPIRFSGVDNKRDFNITTTRAILTSTAFTFVKIKFPEYESYFEKFFMSIESALITNEQV
jgi:hypothetical protein